LCKIKIKSNALFSLFLCHYFCILTENWNRSRVTIQFFQISNHVFILGRTASLYFSILVTIQRYLLVAVPMKAKTWLKNSRLHCSIALISLLVFSIALNLPWLTKSFVDENEVYNWETNSTLGDFPYVIKRNEDIAEIWGRPLQDVLVLLKSIVPFPILLVLNGLLYFSVSLHLLSFIS